MLPPALFGWLRMIAFCESGPRSGVVTFSKRLPGVFRCCTSIEYWNTVEPTVCCCCEISCYGWACAYAYAWCLRLPVVD